jgi:hypothetical protein
LVVPPGGDLVDAGLERALREAEREGEGAADVDRGLVRRTGPERESASETRTGDEFRVDHRDRRTRGREVVDHPLDGLDVAHLRVGTGDVDVVAAAVTTCFGQSVHVTRSVGDAVNGGAEAAVLEAE